MSSAFIVHTNPFEQRKSDPTVNVNPANENSEEEMQVIQYFNHRCICIHMSFYISVFLVDEWFFS